MSITNHYGVLVDSNEPTTGVYGFSDLPEWYFSEAPTINLTFEDWYAEHVLTCETCQKAQDEDRDWCDECAMWEDQPSDTKLVGDWIKDENGQYSPDKNGEYSAIEREFTVQVVWSKFTKRFSSLCSPCYPGQVDVDSDSETDDNTGYLAYVLPEG